MNSFLAPYFTEDEIAKAIEGGIDASCFHSKTGCKINLIPYKEGYICPAINPVTANCGIYDIRPVDCMLYPFTIMWDEANKEILLGLDSKCPYVKEHVKDPTLMEATKEIVSTTESSPLIEIFALNEGLIGPYQDDVIPLKGLKRLSSRT